MVMNVDLDEEAELNLIKDARARSNACYKCGEVAHFQRDCKYDGDKPTDSQQAQGGQTSYDSYDPVVGKWMTNLVAITPITAKAMKSLYAELNRQKDLKQTYRKKYKDLQVVVTTTTEPHVTLQQPIVVTGNKANASPQALKVTPGGQGTKFGGKGKGIKPSDKGKKNAVKASTTGVTTPVGPSSNLRSKLHDKAKVTTAMIQKLMEELQAIEQESMNDEQDSEATQESDLKQEDTENCLTDDEKTMTIQNTRLALNDS